MEALHVLEEKIARLIESKKKDVDVIANLKQEILSLRMENSELKEMNEQFKQTLLSHNAENDAINRERQNTKLVVDEIIGCIDALIAEESPS